MNIVFWYCFPNLSELRNLSAVTPSVAVQTNSGSLYWLFAPKLTKSVAGFIVVAVFLLLLSVIKYHPLDASSETSVITSFTKPSIFEYPLLNPGSTRLISSANS